MVRFLPILLISTIFLFGCNGQEPSVDRSKFPAPPEDAQVVDIEGAHGGIFVIAASQGPKTFNPLVSEDAYSSNVISPFSASIVDYDWQKQEYVPGLAKSWDISEDGLTYTFYLRKGVKWSDGAPFSADDVIFTYDAIFDERYPNRNSSQMTIDGVPIKYKKIDDYTVELSSHKPYAPFINDVSTNILPKHILYKSFEDGTLQKQWSLETAMEEPEKLVGLGPFKVRRFLTGERIVYEPNPHYWKVDKDGKQLPYIDFYIHKFVPDTNTQMVLFSTGQTDAQALAPRDLPWIQKAADRYGFQVYDMGPDDGVIFIWFNQRPGSVDAHKAKWFNNKRFRQAISHSIDRQGLINAVGLGRGEPLYSIIGPANVKWHNKDVPKYEYDPAKARAIFTEELGFKYNKKGELYDKQGNRVEFEFLASEGGNNEVVTTLQENLADLGINMRISFIDFATLIEKTGSSFDYEASTIGLGGGNDEPSAGKAVYLSEGRLHVWNPEQKTPATDWEAEIDRLFNQQSQELDVAKRIEIMHEIQNIFSENVPLIFLYNINSYTGVKHQWKNIKVPPMGSLLWNIDEIYEDPTLAQNTV